MPTATSFAAAPADNEEGWFSIQKVLHVGFSLGISLLAYNVWRNAGLSKDGARAASFGTAMAAGVTKELLDKRVDWTDLAADAVGAGIGAGIAFEF